jgi:hypothetical protein
MLVQVLEAKHATPDTVRIAVAFTNKSTSPAESLRAADPRDLYLVTADGTRRVFLLRDAQNQPVIDGSLKPLQPGERRVLQLMFPAPPAPAAQQTVRVSLHLGPLALRDLRVSP